jgi:ribonuclease T1
MRAFALALIAIAMVAFVACQPVTVARPSPTVAPSQSTLPPATTTLVDPVSGLPWVALSDLPAEAFDTVALIASDGPFPFSQDGIVFQNREGILPAQPSGYYHEYTVQTPGSDDRGAQRIVAGRAGELYYTHDHYSTFERIRK